MHDWNAVITVNERGFPQANEFFREFGPIGRTAFFNVLVLRAFDVPHMLETLLERITQNPEEFSFLARAIPLTRTFNFQTREEFEDQAKEIALAWTERLAGNGFYVRMHRRGFKGRISSLEEERFLDAVILEALEKTGKPGRITFEKPDAVMAVETVAQRGGLSLWSLAEVEKYPFLHLD